MVTGVERQHFHDSNVVKSTATYDYTMFHIRASAEAYKSDHEHCRAFIPDPHLYERKYLGRLVGVILPSVPSIFDPSVYHKGYGNDSGSVNCSATRKAHNCTKYAIEAADWRKNKYYLLVFPDNMRLNNNAFCHGDQLPRRHLSMITLIANDETNMRTNAVYWKIATVGTQR
mmetsp:Transcript_1002/g.2790  ORF Transcript_1002/g.2790 Transcript_1002/m.2790 type:complete len:172 (+) Transcript_1002:362-877(+)